MWVAPIVLCGRLLLGASAPGQGGFQPGEAPRRLDHAMHLAPVEVTASEADRQAQPAHAPRELERALKPKKFGKDPHTHTHCGFCGCAAESSLAGLSQVGVCAFPSETLTTSARCPEGSAVQGCTSNGTGAGILATEAKCMAYSYGAGAPVSVTALCSDALQHPTVVVESGDDWQEGRDVAASCGECGPPLACTCLSPWGLCAAMWWYPDEESGSCSHFVPKSDRTSKGAKVYALCRACPDMTALP